MLHFLLEIIIMTRLTKTRLLLRDKCKVVHSDRLYRPSVLTHTVSELFFEKGSKCYYSVPHLVHSDMVT